MPSHIALNTTASFVTNTNWQYYGGEYDDVVPDADGRARGAAVRLGGRRDGRARGGRAGARAARSGVELGNFWLDLYRSLVYILLPLSIVLAVILISQGVPQTFHGHATATTLQGAQQTIARGPVGSMIAIKQLGTNGGGFYNSNSAVPFENPTRLTNFLEVIAILLIPAAQVVHVREDGARPATRLDGLRGVLRDLRDRRRRCPPGRAARLAGAARAPA